MSLNMNNERIVSWIDSLFSDLEQTDRVLEQKEELQTHFIERIKDYMATSLGFDEAFKAAQKDLGDVDELKAGFQNELSDRAHDKGRGEEDWDEDWGHDEGWGGPTVSYKLVAMSPFVFLILGFAFGWWAWAWVVIPVSGILFGAPISIGHRLIALSPFVFILLGFFFGWWAWGWLVIPITAVLCHDK